MSKILYPVGTPVTVRKSPETEGLMVTQYKKGEKYPYRVGFFEGDEVTVAGKTKFSVKGLKRYNPTQAKVAEAGSQASVAPTPTQTCNCITREEVEAMLMSALNDVYHDLGMSVQSVEGKVMRLAELTDHNFGAVVKKFKTLNHDDD